MAVAAFWLAFYLMPFALLVAMRGWRRRAIALLLVAVLLGWLLFYLRGVETLAFGVGATVALAATSGMAGGMVAWVVETIFRRLPRGKARLAAAGVGALCGFVLVPLLMQVLVALFATW